MGMGMGAPLIIAIASPLLRSLPLPLPRAAAERVAVLALDHSRAGRGGGAADGPDLTIVVGGGDGLPVHSQHRLPQKE